MKRDNLSAQFDIDSVKGLIIKKAIESWRKLPRRTQCMVSIEDMVQDGIVYTMHLLFHSRYKYNSKRSGLTTVLWNGLENHYKRCADALNATKRFDGFNESLEALHEDKGFDVSTIEEEREICNHVRRVFFDVYNHASEGLRESMRKWFLQTESSKIHTKSSRFIKDKKEFKILATKYQLDLQDCRTIMYSNQVRNEIISRMSGFQFEIKVMKQNGKDIPMLTM